VVRDKGDRLPLPEAAAQRTRTGPTATCVVYVGSSSYVTSFFDVLTKSMKGRGQGNGEGSSDDDNKRYQQHPQRRRMPIVDGHSLGQTLAIAKMQLSDPPGIVFAAKGAAQRTSTAPTATGGVSIVSSSCSTCLLTSCCATSLSTSCPSPGASQNVEEATQEPKLGCRSLRVK
jgi:hypothetical protein